VGVGVNLLGDNVNLPGIQNDTKALFKANKAIDLIVNTQTIKTQHVYVDEL
jgi:hypothetical protein